MADENDRRDTPEAPEPEATETPATEPEVEPTPEAALAEDAETEEAGAVEPTPEAVLEEDADAAVEQTPESALAEDAETEAPETDAAAEAEARPRRRARARRADADADEAEARSRRSRARRADADEPSRSARPARPAPRASRSANGRDVARPVVRAQAKYVRSSARKARLVCDHIRGRSVEEARAILQFTPRAVARDWSKLLESAVANAEHNHELDGDDLLIRAAHADEGPTLKRFRPRAMGRATQIRKRTSHLTILLTPKE